MKICVTGILVLCVMANPLTAADGPTILAAEVEAAVLSMFKAAPVELRSRIDQDETQRICSETRNAPPAAQAEAIKAREIATIVYPDDGNVLGDWKKGEVVAQSGAGGQFSDAPGAVRGGNCYACHQMAAAELSFGTLGPSLYGYGNARSFEASAAKAVYAKIFNAQSVQPCSSMPRFGYHKFLTIEQLRDVTAYLMSPDSPVNK